MSAPNPNNTPGNDISSLWTILKQMWDWFAWVIGWVFAPLGGTIWAVQELWANMPTVYAYLVTVDNAIQSAGAALTGHSITTIFASINTVVPLFEYFTWCSVFFVIHVGGSVVRIVKSFIPTIS